MGVAIKVDEDLPAALKRHLRDAGHDALTVTDQGWSGWSDELIWSGVRKEGRLLVTADKGFADARNLSSHHRSGVILLRLDRESWRGYVKLIRQLLSATDIEQLTGAITVVTNKGIRVRRK